MSENNIKAIDKFNWTKIYPKIAEKLRKYKDKREELVKFLTEGDGSKYVPNGVSGGGEKGKSNSIKDIDPFSFFALFNRAINNRNETVKAFSRTIGIEKTEINDEEFDNLNFAGIPIVNNQSVLFFEYKNVESTVPILWELFETSFDFENNQEGFKKIFDEALGESKVSNMIASALYWIHPNKFIPFDENSRTFYYNFFLKDSEDFEGIIDNKKQSIKELREIKFDGYNEIRKHIIELKTKENYQFLNMDNDNKIASISELAWKYDFLNELFVNKNVIFYGPPGTGKTYKVLEAIKLLTKNDSKYFKLVQFHPSFSYEDFIEGIKPIGIENGQLKLELCNGVFKQFCIDVHRANKEQLKSKKPLENYYFIVDEINRGNLSSIFGEMFFCIENSYRFKYTTDDTKKLIEENLNAIVSTQYSSIIARMGEEKRNELAFEYDKNSKSVYFGIPENIYFIGMMNDVDKSIDAFDIALRRRFSWVQTGYDENVVKIELADLSLDEYLIGINNLNKYIADDLGLGSAYTFGHSFFLKIRNYIYSGNKNITKNAKENLFDTYLKPTLREYLRSIYSEKEIDSKNGYIENAKEKFVGKSNKDENKE
ncbi:MAG: AAA family ATPase [Chitinophagales bacterium]